MKNKHFNYVFAGLLSVYVGLNLYDNTTIINKPINIQIQQQDSLKQSIDSIYSKSIKETYSTNKHCNRFGE